LHQLHQLRQWQLQRRRQQLPSLSQPNPQPNPQPTPQSSQQWKRQRRPAPTPHRLLPKPLRWWQLRLQQLQHQWTWLPLRRRSWQRLLPLRLLLIRQLRRHLLLKSRQHR
jgi:hypothetical protein